MAAFVASPVARATKGWQFLTLDTDLCMLHFSTIRKNAAYVTYVSDFVDIEVDLHHSAAIISSHQKPPLYRTMCQAAQPSTNESNMNRRSHSS